MAKSKSRVPVTVKPAPAEKTDAPATLHAAPALKSVRKLVRDGYSIPKAEFAVLQSLKSRATDLRRPVKKSELIRAGIATLEAMSDKAFFAALGKVPGLKSGRPLGAVIGLD